MDDVKTTITLELTIANYSSDEIIDISTSESELNDIFTVAYIESQQHGDFEASVNSDIFTENRPVTFYITYGNKTVDIIQFHTNLSLDNPNNFEHVSKSHRIHCEFNENFVSKIIINNTHEQLRTIKGKELQTEAEAAMYRKQYDLALEKFSKALMFVSDEEIIKSVERSRADAYLEVGIALMKQAWRLEGEKTNDRSKEAMEKFKEAKSMLMSAKDCTDNSEREQNLEIVNLKLEGDSLLNEGRNLEEKARIELRYSEAKEMNEKALVKYKAAQEKFVEGIKKTESCFKSCSIKVNESVARILKIMNSNEVMSKKNMESDTKL